MLNKLNSSLGYAIITVNLYRSLVTMQHNSTA